MNRNIEIAALVAAATLVGGYVIGRKSVKCECLPIVSLPSPPLNVSLPPVQTPAPVTANASGRAIVRCPAVPASPGATPGPPVEVVVESSSTASAPVPQTAVAPQAIVATLAPKLYHLGLGLTANPLDLGDYSLHIVSGVRLGSWPLFIGPTIDFRLKSIIPSGVGLIVTGEF